MFGVAIIVFREVLEAALIIGVVAAASRGIRGRGQALVGGIGAGVVGAVLVAVFADSISHAAKGIGQELFNAIVLGLAVLMLAWHSIWMAQHGAAMATDARRVTQDVREGSRGLSAIVLVVTSRTGRSLIPDTTIKKVESSSSPRGEMGQKYLVAGKHVSMRLWVLELGSELKAATRRDYETVGYVISGSARLDLEGQTLNLKAGDSWLVPEGAMHQVGARRQVKASEWLELELIRP